MKTQVKNKTCTNCIFSGTEIISGEKAMVCKRYAPRIISGSGTGWSGQIFPVVSSDEWCGELVEDDDNENTSGS